MKKTIGRKSACKYLTDKETKELYKITNTVFPEVPYVYNCMYTEQTAVKPISQPNKQTFH